ncbi:MAG: UV DNA damage repair endonuclease UvsE [Clostridia bacterium]|nr:UV DNA damage repair endonuclease UvsE [Clostridia bacterium]
MRIGYACLAVGVPDTKQSSCRKSHATEEVLSGVTRNNLRALDHIIDYNIRNDILLFRISSDLIPFGSSPVNFLNWSEMFQAEWEEIGYKIKQSGMRVSMHPGQYTVLNSNDADVVRRAIKDLEYHALILDNMGLDATHKIILHVGGVYQDKQTAVKRFKQNYQILDESIKKRLVIENDDQSYSIEDVLEIGESLDIPVIFDNLHHALNGVKNSVTPYDWIQRCKSTWKMKDGAQKIHYSQQNLNKRPGSHSEHIRIDDFVDFCSSLNRSDIDIMLEVKDKNLSAVKCINCMSEKKQIKDLEIEWSQYKYAVLERSQEHYIAARSIFSGKNFYSPVDFYRVIEDGLDQIPTVGNAENAAQHVWGYFKKHATEKEKQQFLKLLKRAESDLSSFRLVKNFLWRLVLKYDQQYLMYSYYFFL